MSKAEILKDRLAIIADQLRYIGIEPLFDPDNDRFVLDLKNSNRTIFGIMNVIHNVKLTHYTDHHNHKEYINLIISYYEKSIDVIVKTVEDTRLNYYLGFIEVMVLSIYHSSGININKYYEERYRRNGYNIKSRNPDELPERWTGGIPTKMEKNNFLYHDKISEIDHVKTTFVCPSCWGRVSFNVKSEITFSITSDIDNFDIERTKTTFSPICLNCNQSMFECDEDFVDRIIKLNLLDIVTEYCCSGHKEMIDRISTNGDNTERKEVDDYSYPYIMINLAETKPEVVGTILSKAQKKNSNLRVEFMSEDPFLRIAPALPEYIIVNGTVPYEEDQKNMKDTLFKFIDSIIKRFDKENKDD